MALTLEDIARLSQVSRSTVSRVINGDEKVNTETRQRVQAVIQQYNYQPNQAARRLAAGRTNVLGLVIPTWAGATFNDPYFSQVIQGVSNSCNEQDYSLMLWLSEPDHEQRVLQQIAGNSLVDGVIVSFTLANDPLVASLYRSQVPFVIIGHHPSLTINSVDLDHVEAARQATQHLLERGYRRLATICGPQNQIAGQDRLKGYRLALEASGLVEDPALVVLGDFTEAGGYAAMQKLLPGRPEAVFAANDMMAAGAYRAIQEAGLKIPDEIVIVGFDDLPVASQLNPPLTTIRQPIHRLGQLAVERLIEILREPETPPRQIILDPELLVRTSSGNTLPRKGTSL
jgi:LacI family transcriptional regulator